MTLHHDSGRPLDAEPDAFERWRAGQDPKMWAKHVLGDVVLGWNAAVAAALAVPPAAPAQGDERFELAQLRARLAAIFPLFQEARDALTAIPLASARLHGVDLSLADRMDHVGDPAKWADHPANPARAALVEKP
jgi:hypothetical protein